ncbi:MAG: hypothetical protein ACI4F9_06580 [Lachnospiraceae bacterium]
MKYEFLNPQTGKKWRIEIQRNIIQTYSNNRKWKRVYNDEIEAKKEFKKKILSHLRKGFIYLNPAARWGEIRTQFSLGRNSYTGFMPIATREDRDDFFVLYIVGDFEDEILCHYNEDGKLLSKYSLGADRLSYKIVWGKDDKIYLNNLHQIERFSPTVNELEIIADTKDSPQSMLDLKGNHILWFTGKEIVVYDMTKKKYIWRREVVCQKTDIVHTIYYHIALLSQTGNKLLYRVEKEGYHLIDLVTQKEYFIDNQGWHSFFSPDDCYVNIDGITYDTETGNQVLNPFDFTVKENITIFDACDVISRNSLMAVRQELRKNPLEIREYKNLKISKTIKVSYPYMAQNYNFAFSKNNLVIYTDLGIVTLYRTGDRHLSHK